MAQFVNYKKRDFALPPGCKDLIDVLEPSRRQTKSEAPNSSPQAPDFKQERFASIGLAQIERYASMLLKPRREFSCLTMTSQEFHVSVRLFRLRNQPLGAIVLIIEDAKREQAIRVFFEQQNIKPSGHPKSSASGAGDGVCCLIYPLPPDAPGLIRLTKGLLQNVYGIGDEAGLYFDCYED